MIETISRDKLGTAGARAVRRQGLVPAVAYGTDTVGVSNFAIDSKVVAKLVLDPSFFSRVHNLKIDNKEELVLAKKIQLNPVTDTPIHIEFMRVNKDSRITVSIPVVFINEDKSPALKRGAVLNVIVHALEIVCSPSNIPEKFVVDMNGREAHDTVHLSDIKLPEGAKPANAERDHVVATIVAGASAE